MKIKCAFSLAFTSQLLFTSILCKKKKKKTFRKEMFAKHQNNFFIWFFVCFQFDVSFSKAWFNCWTETICLFPVINQSVSAAASAWSFL